MAHTRDADITLFITLLEARAPRPLTMQDMARMLDLPRYDRRAVQASLEAAVAAGKLRRIGKTRYQWLRDVDQPRRRDGGRGPRTHKSAAAVEGRYTRVRAGFGFVKVLGQAAERFPRDIFIPAGAEGDAMHGDQVVVDIVRRDPRAGRVVGRIGAVAVRAHDTMIGTLERTRDGEWQLVPENELLPNVALVGGEPPLPEQAGLIAQARITQFVTRTQGVTGELESVLGRVDDPEVQFSTIASAHGLRVAFPPEVLAEAQRLPSDPDARDTATREDLRAMPFVTIDGETARDFDDAVCLQPTRAGYRLWVAIADVSHYVRPGSVLDVEASQRATSVYFPDRAIPMLPEQLSSELCSLNPERDRLVLVAEITFDRDGHRQTARFCRAVIRSHARLTYTKVAAVLSDTETPDVMAWRAELVAILPQLHLMRTLMGKLYRNRVQAGSLDLDLPEALVDLSDEGRSIGVRLSHRNDAHRIVEEFMLDANRAVAIFLEDHDVPFPYRIHEPPAPDDVDDLNRFLGPFGFNVNYDRHVTPSDVQQLLTQLQGHRLERVLSRQVLRSLTQAQYRTTNAGHFGLAFPTYCHFTSPIRRYPDLIVHRQLGHVLDGETVAARALAESIEAASVHSSQAERKAMEAERSMLDLKKAEFMLEHLLEPEPATIVSVTAWGMYVELDPYPIEGLIRADTIEGDRYSFIEAERALKGIRTGQRFRLGDRVRVEAVNVSLRRHQVEFALLERLASALPDRPTPPQKRAKTPKAAKPTGKRKRSPPTPKGKRPRQPRR